VVREIRSTATERTTLAPPKWMVNAPQVRLDEMTPSPGLDCFRVANGPEVERLRLDYGG